MKINLALVIFAFTLVSTSCVTRLKTPAGIPDVSISDYENAVEAKTKKIQIYDGFYNQVTVQATWLDSSVTDAGLSHSARLFQWPEQKYKEEKAKAISRHAENTEFFVSLYTPERKHNDLSKVKTAWKMFLDVGGQRYEGKAVKIKSLFSEVHAMYSYHNNWSTPYIISFPVSTAVVEGKPAVLTLTGAISTSQLQF